MARRWTAALLVVALLLPAGAASAQQRRLEHVKPAGGGLEGSGRWALIVGIDDYQSPRVERLAGAVADAEAVRDVLVKYAEFPAQQAILLTSSGKQKPTTRAILTKLEEIRQATQPGDLLLFFFAGHGVEVDGQRYLLGHDADISGPGALKATSLAATALMHELETIRARHRVIMVDACRNDPTKGSRPNVADEGFEAAFTLAPAKEAGVRATLLSTSKGQSAYEWAEKRRGFFSYFIEKGIAGEAANRGKVTLTSLIDYLNESVPQAVRQYRNREQTPYARFEGPPFVLVKGERLPKTVAALDRPAAPPTRVVYGVVKDAAGTPLRGATVSVAVPKGTARALVHEPARRGSANEIATTTDEDGFFRIEGLPADADLKLTASMQNYTVRTVAAPAAENGKKISLFLPSEGTTAGAQRTVDQRAAPASAKPSPPPAAAKASPPPPRTAPVRPSPVPTAVARAKTKAEIAAERKAAAEAKAREEAERKAQAAAQAEAEERAAAEHAQQARVARAQEMAQAAYRTFLVEDFREAGKLAGEALESDADNALANAVLANATMAGVQGTRQDRKAARAFAEKALQRDPNLALAHNALGLVLVAGGDLGAASAAFQRAVQLDPKLGVAHGNLGYVHWQQKRLKDAKRAFEDAAELSPDSAIPYNGLSTVLHSMGRFGDAEKACRKAISRYQLRDESLASFYVQLAVALYEQREGKPGKHEQAREALARAKALGLAAHPAYAVIEGGKSS